MDNLVQHIWTEAPAHQRICLSDADVFLLKRRLKYVVMAAIFALTTPFGIALGIGIRTTYNENSSTALAVNGVLESVRRCCVLCVR